MSADDIWEFRNARAESGALHVHKIGAREGVRSSYYSTASFPIVESASWFQARIRQSIQRLENDQAIILGSLDMNRPKGPKAEFKRESQAYFEKVRPSSWPRPSWNGLNQVLPSAQAQILHSREASIAVQGLCDALRLFHEKTGKVHLDAWDIRCILSENKDSCHRAGTYCLQVPESL
jgi:hypothetical protein